MGLPRQDHKCKYIKDGSVQVLTAAWVCRHMCIGEGGTAGHPHANG